MVDALLGSRWEFDTEWSVLAFHDGLSRFQPDGGIDEEKETHRTSVPGSEYELSSHGQAAERRRLVKVPGGPAFSLLQLGDRSTLQ